MPTRDSWPCDSASGSSPSMNSASSSDSMISINSAYSDDSMEHLSSEERACLMFLEETIESLEAGDDSGVSNDETDRPLRSLANRMAHINPIGQAKPDVHDDPNKVLGKDHKPYKFLVPTPLVLANGNAKLLKKANFSTTEPKPAVLVNAPKTTALNSYQSSALTTSANGTAVSAPNLARHDPRAYSSSELTDLPPSFIPEPPVRPDPSSGAIAKEKPPKNNLNSKSDQKHKAVLSSMPMELLPPPSDFMDEPVLRPSVQALPAGHSRPQTSTQLSPQPASQFQSQPRQSESMPITPSPGFDRHIETNKPQTPLSASPRGQLSPNDHEKLRTKASSKKPPETLSVVSVKPGYNVSDQASFPNFGPDTSAMEYGEPKSPPNVAPKPKKLPSSIVLKSHKDAAPGHSLVSPGDRMIINKQKVHLEALKKLGLLKNDETDSGLSPSPPHKTSPQTSFNTSPSAISSSAGPTAESVLLHSQHHAVVEAQGKTNFSFLPVPPEKGDRESLSVTRAPSPKPFEMKSATMDRSGVGLKRLTLENPLRSTSQVESPGNMVLPHGHLENNQSQNPSEENRKKCSTDQKPSEINRERELRRSLPIPVPAQPKMEPQKSLRSHGISVVISPSLKNGEDRKQALKRLGLIKD